MDRFVNWISANDTQLFHFVNQKLRCRAFDYILPKITHVGGATFTILTLLIVMIFSEKVVQTWAIEALISLSLSHIIVHIIKKIYCRERPYNKLANVTLCSNPLKDYSFPSGHTTAAFSIAIVFSLHMPMLAIFFLPIAILVGVSRMYLGLHYPTDCIIGAVLGTVSSIIVVVCSFVFFSG
ncbi:hypothetical protein BKP37_18580 [Anaerobacillus alkalilacustris]|uniref:Phosphatidic acid phosphatase type 2/haloperoxidase domain-containing protein n=1 Tax=Anaerobacillus alkalilacustris TaxID=393763 RepID=A0A1S2LDT0_9BACI|nr:phosphatase PAP2 family protein [Anaerobacillus alkalilacustris]OIJ10541.1 hypothetical protein BKP37_18580 [Anaerobacillus alkalilacustris]